MTSPVIIEVIMLEISVYLQYPSETFHRNMLAAKISPNNDKDIAKALRYVGIKNYTTPLTSSLTYLFLEKEMWHSCKYMITHRKYDFNHIMRSNDDIRRFYLLMVMMVEVNEKPPIFALFLINNIYLCQELLELYTHKYTADHILYECRWFRFMPNYKTLISTIMVYLTGVKFISSIRAEWIKACIRI